MTYTEVITEVQHLSPAERMLLVETILSWWREELARGETSAHPQARQARLQTIPSASTLRGLARPTGSMPTDAEIQDDYVAHLEHKYA